MLIGYAQNYYFHLRQSDYGRCGYGCKLTYRRPPQAQRALEREIKKAGARQTECAHVYISSKRID